MVKKHLRIDFYREDPAEQRKIDGDIQALIIKAEETVSKKIGKDLSVIIKEYGKVPDDIIHASLIAIGNLYARSDPNADYAFNYILNQYKKA